ncbi:MAG: hypothetical protein ACRDGI_07255 [Candidatus Limnocylindrales bacterium]
MADAWLRILPEPPPPGSLVTPAVDQPALAAQLTAAAFVSDDPVALILTCANCGAAMDERKCKLICSCGYFLSCSDYY